MKYLFILMIVLASCNDQTANHGITKKIVNKISERTSFSHTHYYAIASDATSTEVTMGLYGVLKIGDSLTSDYWSEY